MDVSSIVTESRGEASARGWPEGECRPIREEKRRAEPRGVAAPSTAVAEVEPEAGANAEAEFAAGGKEELECPSPFACAGLLLASNALELNRRAFSCAVGDGGGCCCCFWAGAGD